MKKILSVYFSSERTYITIVEPAAKWLSLLYINSTVHPVNLDNLYGQDSVKGCQEFEIMLNDVPPNIGRISVTLPAESVLISQFPGKSDLRHSDIKRLVDLEIRQSYPNLNIDNFDSSVIPLSPKLDGKQMMMTVIVPKTVIQSCYTLFDGLGREPDSIEMSQMNAINSMLYNYPEERNNTVILFGLDKLFVDISVVTNGKPIYYNLVSLPNKNQIGELCENEIHKLLSEYSNFINSAYFFGSALTKDILVIARNALRGRVKNTSRLNAFRMMKAPQQDERIRSYCSRASHLYPPLIGGCIPSYYEKIMV